MAYHYACFFIPYPNITQSKPFNDAHCTEKPPDDSTHWTFRPNKGGFLKNHRKSRTDTRRSIRRPTKTRKNVKEK
ncbi:unnamed protein product [Caenorhabditis angaria]|uniref:Uncharacterized protein n=1 Tax=Caenorhabditis angaria TaxID=860376 RepID=A0A9P1MTG4_9PELO|nr:unnamed protein product [Caenorhabditis angaria]